MTDKWQSLLEENPFVQKQKAKGFAEGYLEGLRQGLIVAVQTWFPALTELAQQTVNQIDKPDVLNRLLDGFINAPNEEVVRQLLHSQQHVMQEGL